jgi:two-component system, NtrC family, response regulator AtoC
MSSIAQGYPATGIHNATRDILPRNDEQALPMTGRVLIVDDDQTMAETLTKAMTRRGFIVTARTSAGEALQVLEQQDFDVVVTDLHMEGMNGFALCERIVANRPDVPVIMITAFGSMESAVAAIRVGAYDFVTKPFDVEQLRLTMTRAIQHRQLRDEVTRLRQAVSEARGVHEMIGASAPIQKLRDVIDRLCDADAALLITGESGTGKELVARALHQRGRNSTGPFVAINCAAIPEALLESELFGHVKGAFTDARAPRQGLFLKANGGTLFLDEIGEMPIGMQPKLLRVLQERTVRPVGGDQEIPYEARVITATNRDLEVEVAERRFREDLFYRINVIPLRLPSLRERIEEVPLLAEHFVIKFAEQMKKPITGISRAAMARLQAHSWPGNVRELENAMERAVALERTPSILPESLPDAPRGVDSVLPPAGPIGNAVTAPASLPEKGFDLEQHVQHLEREYIAEALRRSNGVKVKAAELLGMSFRSFRYYMKKYNLG